MRRKYKLIIIILISIIFTYMIFFFNRNYKISLLALGDGISSGETSFNIDGISYNDYLRDYFDNKKLLKKYNNNYSYKNYRLKDILDDINDNKNNIKQLIHYSNIITISFGEEELTKLAITKDLNIDYIKDFVNNYDRLINNIKEISDSKIIMIGLYQNKYLDESKVIIINSELSNIANKYNIVFINISDLLLDKDYFVGMDSYYFNYKGHKEITKLIVNSL